MIGRIFTFLFMIAASSSAESTFNALSEGAETVRDYVILIHGMGRTALSMKGLQCSLDSAGYQTINVSYASRTNTVESLADDYLANVIAAKVTDPRGKIHFVTHSLGGIIVRQYLANHRIENLGRVVMIAAPNHGSEVIDWLKANPILKHFLGASARELGTGATDLPKGIGPVNFECGVIAGDRSLNPIFYPFFSEPNDGKVTLTSAKVAGMKDFVVIYGTHTWLMWRKDSANQALHFLKTGHFIEAPNDQKHDKAITVCETSQFASNWFG